MMKDEEKANGLFVEERAATPHSPGPGQSVTTPPFRLLAIITVSVFVAEVFVMFAFFVLPPLPPQVEAFVDSSLLTAALFPILYIFSYRPLSRALENVEKRVRERTAELAIANKRLEASVEQANLMAQKAMVADRAKGEFLANMSHELRTPLSGILGFSELLAQEEITADQKEFLDIIGDSGRRLLAIIENILDFSKIEADKLDMEIIECSPGEILAGVDSQLRPEALKKGIEFEIILASEVPAMIRTNPTRLRQCLLNLVDNAIKFTESGHVRVRASLEKRRDNSRIRFDVEDTGIGVPPDKQEMIFGAFTQADYGTTRKYGGTGLGLAITKRLAKILGGELLLQSDPGRGSVFSLIIPAGVDA